MTRYRNKPVEVEAWQVGSDEPMPEWLMRSINKRMIRLEASNSELIYVVRAARAEFRAKKNDYIVHLGGIDPNVDVLPSDIFEQTYEVVSGREAGLAIQDIISRIADEVAE